MISETDVRAMVRLLGDTLAVRRGCAEQKRFLMDGLCLLVGGEKWLWGLYLDLEPGTQPVYVNITHSGFSDEQFASLIRAMEHPDLATLTAPFTVELKRRKGHTTRLRQQTDPENQLRKSPSHVDWDLAGIKPGILSCRPLDEHSFSTIAIYRSPDAPDFSERESRIAHIILTEVHWLHELGWPEDRGASVPSLSPRQRVTLNLLLEGHSRKEIAHHMDISVHTVAEYIKAVYRHFGVQSQAELLRHFLAGDGGDGLQQG